MRRSKSSFIIVIIALAGSLIFNGIIYNKQGYNNDGLRLNLATTNHITILSPSPVVAQTTRKPSTTILPSRTPTKNPSRHPSRKPTGSPHRSPTVNATFISTNTTANQTIMLHNATITFSPTANITQNTTAYNHTVN